MASIEREVDAMKLEAGRGLFLNASPDRPWTIAWGSPDWLGPLDVLAGGREIVPHVEGSFEGEDDLGAFRALELEIDESSLPLRATARAYLERALLVFRLEAAAPLDAFASGEFDRPAVAWPRFRPAERRPGGLPEDTRGFGHAYTEFALPSFSGPELDGFLLLPQRPAVVEPLFLVIPGGRSLMLAPLDSFHEQVVAVPRRGEAELGVRCGWHGDLNQVPAGFRTELAGIDELLKRADRRVVLEHVADHQHAVLLARDLDQLTRFVGRRRDGLLDQDVLAGFETTPRQLAVRLDRRGDHYGSDLGVGERAASPQRPHCSADPAAQLGITRHPDLILQSRGLAERVDGLEAIARWSPHGFHLQQGVAPGAVELAEHYPLGVRVHHGRIDLLQSLVGVTHENPGLELPVLPVVTEFVTAVALDDLPTFGLLHNEEMGLEGKQDPVLPGDAFLTVLEEPPEPVSILVLALNNTQFVL